MPLHRLSDPFEVTFFISVDRARSEVAIRECLHGEGFDLDSLRAHTIEHKLLHSRSSSPSTTSHCQQALWNSIERMMMFTWLGLGIAALFHVVVAQALPFSYGFFENDIFSTRVIMNTHYLICPSPWRFWVITQPTAGCLPTDTFKSIPLTLC
jgi:hypothetical protein